MWLIKTRDQDGRERNIVAHGWLARTLAETLSEFGYSANLFLVSEHFDPVSSTKFILDPITNEPLRLPRDYVRKLRDEGYFEVHPLRQSIAVAVTE